MTVSNEARDERLAAVLADLVEQRRRGQSPDLEAIAADHPDLGAELRQLYGAALLADELGHTEAPGRMNLPPTSDDTGPANGVPSGPLPRDFGDFELREELGRGGMGIVYKAWQKSLRRLVALKMILRGDAAVAKELARFEAEAQAAAQLHHPHIVPVYGAGVQDGLPYFTMHFVAGQTLATLLARGPMRPQEAARLLADISDGVDYAHEHGLLHRDLKPSNILIDQEGRPYVTDFGLAKRVAGLDAANGERKTVSGTILGTPAYMAPEQVSGKRGPVSPASDVYSLGVILYEMLTGRPPFQAASVGDTLLLVLEQEPVRPRLLNPGVDPDLEMICLKCLQKEPDLRYPSARALADDLEAFLAGETTSVRQGGLRQVGNLFSRIFRETPNAVVLENWGLLWMLHSLKAMLLCLLTAWLAWSGVEDVRWYLLLWGGGLIVWGLFFWRMRQRAGPVLFVERQVAHIWGGAIVATIGTFVLEILMGLHPLDLAPVLALLAGMTFAVKGGMLSGSFYLTSAALFLTAVPMALLPRPWSILLFGVATSLAFFVPGLKYHRQRLRARRASAETGPIADGERGRQPPDALL
jgi:serine/threonine-protein kinase